MVDEAIRKYPQPVADKPAANGKTIATVKVVKRKPILDERTANVFPNEHQFQAFREAVTTPAAQKVIPVQQQVKIAKEIMTATHTSKKLIGAPFIKKTVQHFVEQGMKEQRSIDKNEREQMLREQREARIDNELHSAKISLRSLMGYLAVLIELAEQFPAHPKLGGFSAKLDELIPVIKQFSSKLK